MTSRQTNASSGSVDNMLSPKHRRAMLTMMLFVGKLLSTFPCVMSPKVRYPASAMSIQATIEMVVLKCVTLAKRSSVGFFSEP